MEQGKVVEVHIDMINTLWTFGPFSSLCGSSNQREFEMGTFGKTMQATKWIKSI